MQPNPKTLLEPFSRNQEYGFVLYVLYVDSLREILDRTGE